MVVAAAAVVAVVATLAISAIVYTIITIIFKTFRFCYDCSQPFSFTHYNMNVALRSFNMNKKEKRQEKSVSGINEGKKKKVLIGDFCVTWKATYLFFSLYSFSFFLFSFLLPLFFPLFLYIHNEIQTKSQCCQWKQCFQ